MESSEQHLQTPLLDGDCERTTEKFLQYIETGELGKGNGGLKSLLTASAFTINFIFGAGILGIPIAFVSGGIIAGLMTLALVSIFSTASMIWEVETAGRAETIVEFEENKASCDIHQLLPQYKLTPGRFNIPQLCVFFLGPKWEKFYEVCLWLNTISTMWLYTVIFVVSGAGAIPLPHLATPEGESTTHCDISGTASALNLPGECMASYYIFWAVFAILGLFLSSQNIAEQRRLHLMLTVFGLTCIVTMVLTAAAALASEPFGIHHFPHSHIAEVPLLFDAGGFSRAFNTFIFAQMAHPGVPQLLEVMDNPRQANSAFKLALSVTSMCYIALGLTCAFFFGEGVKDVITLNWKDYTAERQNASLFSLAISYMVRIFPVITVTAAFPLNAICLGETLYKKMMAKGKNLNRKSFVRLGGFSISKKVLCTWLACAFPLIGGAFLSSISFLTSAIGLCGFVLAFLVPGCLQLASIRAVHKRLLITDEKGTDHLEKESRDANTVWGPFMKFAGIDKNKLCGGGSDFSKAYNRTCTLSSDFYVYVILLFCLISIAYTIISGLKQVLL